MPRVSMDNTEILRVKEKILDIAAEIIMQDGYQNLSMRKIGSKIGMTASNLYNYYSNKDEINIAIRLRAGRLLYEVLLNAYETGDNISDKIGLMADGYVKFGLLKPNYYSIMFDMPTPKFANYVNSPLEGLAKEEKESTEKSIELLMQCVRDFADEGYQIPYDPYLFMTIIWGQVHGLVSLYNNNLLSETLEVPDETIKEATGLVHEIIFGFLVNKA